MSKIIDIHVSIIKVLIFFFNEKKSFKNDKETPLTLALLGNVLLLLLFLLLKYLSKKMKMETIRKTNEKKKYHTIAYCW